MTPGSVRQPKRPMKAGLLFIVIVGGTFGGIAFLCIVFGLIGRCIPQAKAPPAVKAAPKWDKSDGVQAQRLAAIQKLIDLGTVAKVDADGHMPRVWVNPGFALLSFDAKQTALGLVYAYYFDGNGWGDTVYIVDNRTGREWGYLDSSGLRWTGP